QGCVFPGPIDGTHRKAHAARRGGPNPLKQRTVLEDDAGAEPDSARGGEGAIQDPVVVEGHGTRNYDQRARRKPWQRNCDKRQQHNRQRVPVSPEARHRNLRDRRLSLRAWLAHRNVELLHRGMPFSPQPSPSQLSALSEKLAAPLYIVRRHAQGQAPVLREAKTHTQVCSMHIVIVMPVYEDWDAAL